MPQYKSIPNQFSQKAHCNPSLYWLFVVTDSQRQSQSEERNLSSPMGIRLELFVKA